AWIVGGVAVLVWRWWRAEGERRRELTLPLASIGMLAGLLLMVVVVRAAGLLTPSDALFLPLFLLALGTFPAALLVAITARTRSLERRLVESRHRLVAAEDSARSALERDLHDGVQQQIVAILSLTELANHQSGRDPEAAAATLADVTALAETAIRELRELVSGLRPPVLTDAGLVAALNSRFSRLPAEIRLEAVGPTRRADPAVEA